MSIGYRRPLWVSLTAFVILLLGAVMTAGGGYLGSLGGSWYYLIAVSGC